MEDSKMIAAHHLLRKAAVLLALLRRVLSWALKLRDRAAAATAVALSSVASVESPRSCSPPPPASSCASSEIAGDGLPLATYGAAVAGRPGVSCDTCTVCFSPMAEGDEVRVLRNCCHLYHRECLDRWVGCDHDQGRDRSDGGGSNHRRCPLCRAPLWGPPPPRPSSKRAGAGAERGWSVKRLCSSVRGGDP